MVMAPAPALKVAVPPTVSTSAGISPFTALVASVIDVPVMLALARVWSAVLEMITEVPASAVTEPAEVSARLAPVLRPVRMVAVSSVTATAPAVVLKLSLPKFTVPGAPMVMAPAPALKVAVPSTLSTSAGINPFTPLVASVIDVPVMVALAVAGVVALVMTTEVPASAVTEPAEVSARLAPVLRPVRIVALSSVTATAPAALTFNLLKLTVPGAPMVMVPRAPTPVALSVAVPPTLSTSAGITGAGATPVEALVASRIDVPVMAASLVMTTEVPASAVTEPAEVSARLAPVLRPVRIVALSSLMLTAPRLLNVSEPVLKVSNAPLVPMVIEVPVRLELPVTAMTAVPVLVNAPPVLVATRLPVAVVLPKMRPPVPSTRVTFLPVLVTAPTKLLAALPSVMSYFTLPPPPTPLSASSVVAPVMVTSPVAV